MECPKCHYVRTSNDNGPESECPKCGIIYSKYDSGSVEREAALRAKLTLAAKSTAKVEPHTKVEVPPVKMSFSEFVRTDKIEYEIDSALIAIGNRTWQTHNISSVGVNEHIGVLEVPEPRLDLSAEPKRSFSWGLMALGIAVSWTLGLVFNNPALIGLIGSILTIGFIWFVGYYSHKSLLTNWKRLTSLIEKKNSFWQSLTSNLPAFYIVSFDSTGGKEIALVTLDQTAVVDLKKAILDSMRNPTSPAVRGFIQILKFDGAKPNDLVSRYYEHMTT